MRVRGEAPFEATLDGNAIRIKTQGRTRALHVTQPPFVVRPQMWIDGQEWMPSWTDYPVSGWGSYQNTRLMSLPIPEGSREVVVKDLVFAPVWARSFDPSIKGVVRDAKP